MSKRKTRSAFFINKALSYSPRSSFRNKPIGNKKLRELEELVKLMDSSYKSLLFHSNKFSKNKEDITSKNEAREALIRLNFFSIKSTQLSRRIKKMIATKPIVGKLKFYQDFIQKVSSHIN